MVRRRRPAESRRGNCCCERKRERAQNRMRLAELLRAAKEAMALTEFGSSRGETSDSPTVVGDGWFDADSEGAPEGEKCAVDAHEATEPRAPQRRGGAGAARGGGAEISAGAGPQERPGPALRKRASSRGTAPEAAACAPQEPRKGGGIVRHKASRRGEPQRPMQRRGRR